MDFSLRLLGSEIDHENDLLDNFKRIMSDYFWVYAQASIIHTRCYLEGLRFIERLTELNEHYQNIEQLTSEKYAKHDRYLIEFNLVLFDKLDLWSEYIYLFERVRIEKTYRLIYDISRRGDSVFDSYVLSTDHKFKYVHFLYAKHNRFELIKKKLKKVHQGKKVGNMYHKPQSDLTREEIEERFNHILYCAERGLPVFLLI